MNHTRFIFYLMLSCLMLASMNGCKSLQELSQLNIPTAGFRGASIQGIQTNPSSKAIVVKLGLRFRFANPYKIPLRIPEHRFGLKINDKSMSSRLRHMPSFLISPQSDTLVVYDFSLDLSSRSIRQLNVLGKDNRYEFEADVSLDLADYNLKLPAGLGRKTFHLSFSDSIRLPKLPLIEPSGEMASIRFLGEMERFDLSVFQQAFTPFIDQLLTAKFEQDMMAPFIEQLKGMECPAGINQSKPCIDMFSGAVTSFIHTAFVANPPLRGQLLTNWNDLKTELLNAPEAEDPIIDEIINTFLPEASNSLEVMKAQWQHFKNSPAEIRYPGPRVKGLLVRIPFMIYNPNEFAIDAPAIFVDTELSSGYHPLRFEAGQANHLSRSIPAGSKRKMQLVMELDWSTHGGIQALMLGESQLMPRLKGNTSIDVGYGPMEVQMDIPLNLSLGENE